MSDIKMISLPLVEYQQLDAIRDQKELLLGERDALQAKLEDFKKLFRGKRDYCEDCLALKAEVERLKEAEEIAYRLGNEKAELLISENRWKKLAEGLAVAGRYTVLTGEGLTDLDNAVAAFDAVQKGRGV